MSLRGIINYFIKNKNDFVLLLKRILDFEIIPNRFNLVINFYYTHFTVIKFKKNKGKFLN
jgi:hypothetical protein